MAAASPGAFASGLAKHETMCYSGTEEDVLPPGWDEPVLKGLGSVRVGPLRLFFFSFFFFL